MKKKRYLQFSIIVILIFFNILLLNETRKLRREYILLANKKDMEIANRKGDISFLMREAYILQYKTESTVCPNVHLTEPQKNEKCRFFDLIKDGKPKLFFRFKETVCDACIQKALSLLTEIQNKYPYQKINILSGYINIRQFYAYANNKQKMFNIFNISNFPIELESQDNPYFFMLNGNLEMKNVFIYTPEHPELAIDYLQCIIQKYWADDCAKK